MSETKKTSGNAKESGGSSAKTESKTATKTTEKSDAKATPAASDSKTSSNPVSKSTTIQNGKGSAPRNMGPTFKKNFGKIKWGDTKKQLEAQSGQRKVKVYG